jgi:GTP-binding protein
MMLIKKVEFIKSAVKPSQYPEYEFPEIAFAGRSNVGKSSLINTLVNRKDIVKTSSTPGCTRLINFFMVNESLSFVDLPGYGYAKVSKKERLSWQPMINQYLSFRKNLMGLVLLVDIRRVFQKEEADIISWVTDRGLPCLLVLTKADKLSNNNRQKRLTSICSSIELEKEDVILFSAKTRLGREIIWEEINNLIGCNYEKPK